MVFRDQILNLDMHIGEALVSSAHILLRSRGARSSSGRHVQPMIDIFQAKIHVGDIQIFLVHKLFKVVANKSFICSRGSRVLGFIASLFVAFML